MRQDGINDTRVLSIKASWKLIYPVSYVCSKEYSVCFIDRKRSLHLSLPWDAVSSGLKKCTQEHYLSPKIPHWTESTAVSGLTALLQLESQCDVDGHILALQMRAWNCRKTQEVCFTAHQKLPWGICSEACAHCWVTKNINQRSPSQNIDGFVQYQISSQMKLLTPVGFIIHWVRRHLSQWSSQRLLCGPKHYRVLGQTA